MRISVIGFVNSIPVAETFGRSAEFTLYYVSELVYPLCIASNASPGKGMLVFQGSQDISS